ncbi:MAG TPA: cyclic nucleotide-binding domain-containing protein [Thermotogota bacterium]|nr:cyclic nucleotide-binding domain-containing protein [Thermotogota bacterium]HRW91830.1 cyclic nucleotide-binding domain-containing protein [Thermotogota bacterium]
MSSKSYDAGEIVFLQGEPDSRVYRLEKGKVILFVSGSSNFLLDVLDSPRFFGFAPFLNGVHSFCAEAYQPSVVEILPISPPAIPEAVQENLFMDMSQLVEMMVFEEEDSRDKRLHQLMEQLREFREPFLWRFFSRGLVSQNIKLLLRQKKIKETGAGHFRFY